MHRSGLVSKKNCTTVITLRSLPVTKKVPGLLQPLSLGVLIDTSTPRAPFLVTEDEESLSLCTISAADDSDPEADIVCNRGVWLGEGWAASEGQLWLGGLQNDRATTCT